MGSDIRPIGSFACSDPLLNQLHSNVVWGMKGNFLSVPTDCPQRDERLGWTGDLAVFAPTAAFLGDVESFLADWLTDAELERQATPEQTVPVVVPNVMKYLDTGFPEPGATAVWGDAAVWVPWALWMAYGHEQTLRDAYPLMTAHTRGRRAARHRTALWDGGFQFGDWLDPDAPADDPGKSKAPSGGRRDGVRVPHRHPHGRGRRGARRARRTPTSSLALRDRIGDGFRRRYVEDGRVESDSVTAYALAIAFGLLEGDDRQKAGDRLAELVRAAGHRISTGFAGTPFVNDALTATGHLDDAYALLLQPEAPSWLYAVTMGATTIWERWDSMLPDGSINPGEMTSFNHYAFGAVADWMHRSVAGLAPLEPGYRRILVAPQPGGGLTWAEASLETPLGRAAVRWDARRHGHPRADRGARGCRGGGAAARVRGRDRRRRHPCPSEQRSERMTDTHDIALEGGGHDFRVRVYPAAEPSGAVLVWLHGGAFMFGTLEMPEADQVGRRLSAAGRHRGLRRLHARAAGRARVARPARPDAGLPVPRAAAGRSRSGRSPGALPRRRRFRRSPRSTGRCRTPARMAPTPTAWRWAARAPARTSRPVRRCDCATGGRLMPSLLALVYPSLHDGILSRMKSWRGCCRASRLPASSRRRPATRSTATTCPTVRTTPHGYAFPGGHDLAGLPPVLMVNAELDSLRASGEAFAGELAAASVDVQVVRARGAMHGYLNEVGASGRGAHPEAASGCRRGALSGGSRNRASSAQVARSSREMSSAVARRRCRSGPRSDSRSCRASTPRC